MRSPEDLLALRVETNEVGDVEESPVVDRVGSLPPEGEPVVLTRKNLVDGLRSQIFGACRKRKALVKVLEDGPPILDTEYQFSLFL